MDTQFYFDYSTNKWVYITKDNKDPTTDNSIVIKNVTIEGQFMKKIFKIILAVSALVTSVTTAIWYAMDDDPNTKPNVEQVIIDYTNVKDAFNK